MMVPIIALNSLQMASEVNRTYSFGQPEWHSNHSKLCSLTLARIGFYFDGSKRSVTCFSCHFTQSLDEGLDDLENEHKRLSPQCEMCRGTRDDGLHIAIEIVKAFNGDQVDGLLSKRHSCFRNIALIFSKAYNRAKKSGAVKSSVDIPTDSMLGFEADTLSAASRPMSTASLLCASTIKEITHIDRQNPDYQLLRYVLNIKYSMLLYNTINLRFNSVRCFSQLVIQLANITMSIPPSDTNNHYYSETFDHVYAQLARFVNVFSSSYVSLKMLIIVICQPLLTSSGKLGIWDYLKLSLLE